MEQSARMSHVTVQRQGKAYHVPLATVQDIIDLMDANYAKARVELLSDLEAMSASEESKLQAMKEMRERKGMTTDLIRQAFTLEGARAVVEHVVDPAMHAAVMDSTPDELVQTALTILGFDMTDDADSKEEKPANPPKGGATSTTKP